MSLRDSDDEQRIADRLSQHLASLENGTVTRDGREEISSGLYQIVEDLHWVSQRVEIEPTPGARIGKYRLTRPLGSGGQSATYLAEDPDLQREVVLKIYHGLSSDPAEQKVLQEGRLLSKVDSPFVVKCLAVESLTGEADVSGSTGWADQGEQEQVAGNSKREQPVLVLDYVRGTPLDVLLRLRPTSMAETRQFVLKLSRGLACVHKAGLIHRDIKPGNIIIDDQDEPRLIDFGLAISTQDDVREPGSGTAAYMSPEQAQQRDDLDERTDIFGIGAVLYHLLTGFPPFRAASHDQARELACRGAVQEPRTLNPAVSADLARICMKCLSVDPESRYQSAEDLVAALEKPRRRYLALGTCVAGVLVALAALASPSIRPPAGENASALTVKVHGGERNVNGVYEFQIDEEPYLEVSVGRGGHLRVWSIEGNSYRQLFPNSIQPDRMLAPGEKVLVPDPNKAALKLAASVETEFFRVVVSDSQLPVLRGKTRGYFAETDSQQERDRIESQIRGSRVSVRAGASPHQVNIVAEQFIPYRVLSQDEHGKFGTTGAAKARAGTAKNGPEHSWATLDAGTLSDRLRRSYAIDKNEPLYQWTSDSRRLRAEGRWEEAADTAASTREWISKSPHSFRSKQKFERFLADSMDVAGRAQQAISLRGQILKRFNELYSEQENQHDRREMALELRFSHELSDQKTLDAWRQADRLYQQFLWALSEKRDDAYELIERCVEVRADAIGEHHVKMVEAYLWRGICRCEKGSVQGGRDDLTRALQICSDNELDGKYNELATVWNFHTGNPNAPPVNKLAKKPVIIVDLSPDLDSSTKERFRQWLKHVQDRHRIDRLLLDAISCRQPAEATDLIKQTRSLAIAMYGQQSSKVADVDHWRGRILWASGRKEEARTALRSAWESYAEALDSDTNSGKSLLRLSTTTWQFLPYWVATLDMRRQENARIAYDALWQSRGLTDWSIMRDATELLSDEAREEVKQLAALQQRLSSSFYGISSTEAIEKSVAQLDTEKRQLKQEIDRLSQSLIKSDGQYRAAMELRNATVDDLVRLLPTDTAVVEFYQSNSYKISTISDRPNKYAAFVVRNVNNQPDIQWIELCGIRELDRELETWLSALGPAGAATDARQSAQRIYRRIWKPLKVALHGVTAVVVIPQGNLSKLPWSALPLDQHDRPLLESLDVSLVGSGQELLYLLGRPKMESEGLLVMGGVNYGADPGENAARRQERSAGLETETGNLTWQPLAATAREAQAVQGIYPSNNVRWLSDDQATEENVQSEIPNYRFIHLATHGFFDYRARSRGSWKNGRYVPPASPRANPALEFQCYSMRFSGLVLAGANQIESSHGNQTGEKDGVLSAQEVANLHLPNTELVVLSACDSSLGRPENGEGSLGLQRAFHLAGARTVISSLWKVDDQAARILMTRFYKNLWQRGMGKRESLREAQSAMRSGALTQGAKQPTAAWAGWVLSGDYR